MNWIEVNGTSLRCELSGSGKTTLVLVHEMGGTLESWDQAMPALNNSRRVLRYDTRGAGLSAKLGGVVTWDAMADDIAALLDAHGIAGKVALAGTAVGAGIAIHFAVRHAARARRAGGKQSCSGGWRGSAAGDTGQGGGGRGEGHARYCRQQPGEFVSAGGAAQCGGVS